MFLELIAVIVAGFIGAGLALILRRVFPTLPGWLMPACVGAAMILVALANEYGWYARQAGGLPNGVRVAQTHVAQSALRPWTLVMPFTNRFVAVDHDSLQTHPDHPDLRMVDLLFFARWQPVVGTRAVFDCAARTRADLNREVRFAADGTLRDATWVESPPGDPLITQVCEDG